MSEEFWRSRAKQLKNCLSYFALFGLLFLCSFYGIAFAQQTLDSITPGQVEKQFEPFRLPESAPPDIVPGAKDIKAPEDSATINFVLRGVVLQGNETIPSDELEHVYASDLGEEITVSRLYGIANEISAAYRNRGYILSQAVVPEQEISDDGVVTLQIIEGYISSVEMSDGYVDTAITKYLAKLSESRPLRADVIERQMLLSNDLPGVTVRSVIAPSEEPNASKLKVQAYRDGFSGFVGVTNRGSEFQGPVQLSAELRANDSFGPGMGGWRFYGVSTADDELNHITLSRNQHLSPSGLRLSGSVSATKTEPGAFLAVSNIETDSYSGNFGIAYPAIRSRTKNLTYSGTLSLYQGESQRVDTVESTGREISSMSEDSLGSVRLKASYDVVDSLLGVNLVEAEISQGFDAFGEDDEVDPESRSRPNGEVDYTKLTLYLARVQSIGNGFSMLIAADAQYAFDDLLSSEQFGVGGANFSRGYDSSEIVGDSGLSGVLELRYARSSSFSWLNEYILYGFVDGGEISRKTPLEDGSGQLDSESISSYGFGIRFKFLKKFSGYLEFANPSSSRNIASENNNDPRVFFSLTREF